MLAFGAADAVADELTLCVEEALTAEGFDPGAVDGVFDDATGQAAGAFLDAAGIAIPRLSEAISREWCGVLANWGERSSGPPILQEETISFAGITDLAGAEADALPRGIHFSPSIPVELRRLIIDDLIWLAGLDEVPAADQLAAAMNLPLPLSGRDMIGWLLDHAMAIATLADGCREAWIAEAAIARTGRCDNFEGGIAPVAAVSLTTAEAVPGATAVLRDVGDMWVVAPAGPWVHMPVIYINADNPTWESVGPAARGYDGRLGRLTSLFHEASHIAFNERHWPCRGDNPVRNLVGDVLPHSFCDDDIRTSSYLFDALVGASLVAACDDCTYRIRINALIDAIGNAAGVTVPLIKPAVSPNAAYLAAYGLAGISYAFVPPAAYFDIAAVQIATYLDDEGCPCGNALDTLPDRLEAMRQLAEEQHLHGNLITPWLLEPPQPEQRAPPASWADVWLRRAAHAKDDGYNVPLNWVVDCPNLPGVDVGCAAIR